MSEHFIRLRGGWERTTREGDAGEARRVDLPTDWPIGADPAFRLRRRFGRPSPGPSAASIRLEMLGVPGLVSARLNGRELVGPDLGGSDWSVPLTEPLLSRNVLVLEVDLGGLREPPKSWGAIALVISPLPGPPD